MLYNMYNLKRNVFTRSFGFMVHSLIDIPDVTVQCRSLLGACTPLFAVDVTMSVIGLAHWPPII